MNMWIVDHDSLYGGRIGATLVAGETEDDARQAVLAEFAEGMDDEEIADIEIYSISRVYAVADADGNLYGIHLKKEEVPNV